jgi:hypothetical protein
VGTDCFCFTAEYRRGYVQYLLWAVPGEPDGGDNELRALLGGRDELFRGNVGIGTMTLSTTLEVNGTAKFDGVTQFNNTVTFSSSQTFNTPNPLAVALLRWYPANQAGNQFSVGTEPNGVAFDGANPAGERYR